ncbi:MAG: FAD-dependent oxidoreductase [Euzebya sp.]
MTHVAVIGAGIVGLATARELCLRGADVTVLERGMIASGTSSRGEGNMLVSDKQDPAEAALALRSLALWQQFSQESAQDFEYEVKGGLIVASTPRQLDLLRQQAVRQQTLGIRCDVVSEDDLRHLEPGLRQGLPGGVHFPQDAQVMPIQAVRALATATVGLGGVVRTDVVVTGLTSRPGGGVRVSTSTGPVDADAVVNAAGPWAGQVAKRLGGQAAVFPRRGLLLVTEPLPPGTVRHKVYDGRYVDAVASDLGSAQIAPVIEATVSGTILIGSTREAVGWDTQIPWDLVGQLARQATVLFPALDRVSVLRTYQGFRPATPDHLPLIGPDQMVEGLFHNTGHEGAGIGLALGSAEVLAAAILQGKVDPAFDPRRHDEPFEGSGAAAPSPRPVRLTGGTSLVGDRSAVTTLMKVMPGELSDDLQSELSGSSAGGPSTVAAALLRHGQQAWRRTRLLDQPRGLFCGIGHCHDCVVSAADGRTVRACLQPNPQVSRVTATARPASPVQQPDHHLDVLIIGGGPGGLTVAQRLASAGRRVGLIDRYDQPGGQIARQPAGRSRPVGDYAGLVAIAGPGLTRRLASTVVMLRRAGEGRAGFQAVLETDGILDTLSAAAVVLATGAREIVAPFPGWTLPGVITAGAVQALIKREGSAPWRRIGLAGSGPLLLAVAQAMRQAGQPAVFTAEAQPLRHLVTAGLTPTVRYPRKAAQFARLTAATRPRFGWTVVRAVGRDHLQAVVLGRTDGRGSDKAVPVDALAVSSLLIPDVTLAVQLGCAMGDCAGGVASAVRVDDRQQTSVTGVYAVGEITGVGGADKAIAEGRVAAAALLASSDGDRVPGGLVDDAKRWRHFAGALERLYPMDQTWAQDLPDEEVICRCEEVSLGTIRQAMAEGANTARAIKGMTRCGMGYCQGGVCGPLVRSALQARGHQGGGDLESRPLAGPVTLDQLARLTSAPR